MTDDQEPFNTDDFRTPAEAEAFLAACQKAGLPWNEASKSLWFSARDYFESLSNEIPVDAALREFSLQQARQDGLNATSTVAAAEIFYNFLLGKQPVTPPPTTP